MGTRAAKRAGGAITAAALGVCLLLNGGVAPAVAGRPVSPPLRLDVLSFDQREVVDSGAVRLQLLARRRLAVSVSVRGSPVRIVVFGRPGRRAVTVPLSPRARSGLAACRAQRLVVEARRTRVPLVVGSRWLRLDRVRCRRVPAPASDGPGPASRPEGPGDVVAASIRLVGGTLAPPAGASGKAEFEPGIARDGAGQIWVAASNFVARGADLWTSTDGGASFGYAASPFQETGYDVDVAAAPEPDAQGRYAVYAANQNGDTGLAVSRDQGRSWAVTHIGGVPEQDRPWIAADGPCTLYASYYDPDGGHAWVDRYDTCNGPPTLGGRIPTLLSRVPDPYSALGSIFGGKIVVDTSPSSPYRHSVYIPTGGCAVLPDLGSVIFPPTPAVAEDCQALPVTNAISISRDGGVTWKSVHIADVRTSEMSIWPDQLAVGVDGTLYQTWGDQRHVYVARSTTGGESWDPPVSVPAPGAGVLPQVAAGPPGKVSVAFYSADRPGYANDKSLMATAEWRLAFATSSDGGRNWSTQVLPTSLYTGPVCTTTHFCNGPGKGASPFLEDFGALMDPRTGLSSVAYAKPSPGSGQPARVDYLSQVPGG